MDSLSRALQLPAQRLDAAGRAHVDQRAVLALALPLMANSTVQIVLNLTDMWFMGRISTKALAAVGAVQWLVIVVVLVLGGAGTAVQTLVAQNFGARRYRRAGQAVWTALWAMGCAAPLFVLVGAARHLILAPFGVDSQVAQLAAALWLPRGGAATERGAIRPEVPYSPASGAGSEGTTLVGQCSGAGAGGWARRGGNGVILAAVGYMGGIGVRIGLGGPWVLPFFTGSNDSD